MKRKEREEKRGRKMVDFLSIDHVTLNVRNLDEVVDFYVTKLGFKEVGPSPEVRKIRQYVMLQKGEIGIELMVPDGVENMIHPEGKGLGETHIAFKVSNVKGAYEELVKNGVEFSSGPRFVEKSGRTLVYFADPEGNRLHLTD